MEEKISIYKECLLENVKCFLDKASEKQTDIAKACDLSSATISNYKNGNTVPQIEFLLYLYQKYQISMNDFFSRKMTYEEIVSAKERGEGQAYLNDDFALRKFVGIYQIYYFYNGYSDDGFISHVDQMLNYGILQILDVNGEQKDSLQVRAIMGLGEKRQAEKQKYNLEGQNRKQQEDVFNRYDEKHVYKGTFSATPNHLVLDLECSDVDCARILFLNPRVMRRKEYVGGLGTMNSISRAQYIPCIQLVGLSRINLTDVSPEEIAEFLYINGSAPMVCDLTELENFIREIYNNSELELSAEEKNMLISNRIRNFVYKQTKNNYLRVGKVKKRDEEWYRMIKPYMKREKI